ncbi:MAG: flagellar protein FlaG [Candidatus Nitrotoga sp.]|nr:flagellar protein FlaG [Candidatus Nitrotoga sp.]
MLIQSTSNMAQASPPGKISSDGLASNSKSIVVSAPPSNGAVQPGGSLELPQVATVQVSEQQASSAQLQSVVNDINKVLKQSNRNLEFSVDTATQKPVVKLMDTDTGDLIRQYPSEEMLAISSAIDQFQQVVLLEQKA